MTDIHTIKNLFDLLSYMRQDTWYMLWAWVMIYVIYIVYLVVFERYHKSQQIAPAQLQPEAVSIQEQISRLSLDDREFFEKLSFLIRSHLENTAAVTLATKKTQKEIEESSISERLKAVLRTCARYEYTEEEATQEEKEQLIDWLKNVI